MSPSASCALCGSERRQLLRETVLPGLTLRTVICLDCGLVYHHPLPTEQEKRHAAGNGVSLHCHRVIVGSVTKRHRQNVARYLDALGPVFATGRSLLDIGCGEGGLLQAARGRGMTAVGVEPEAHHAAAARAQSDAEIIEARFEAADLGERRFDLITCTHVLEHADDPCGFLQRARGLLAPGGRLFVEVPNVLRPRQSYRSMFTLPHNYQFSPQTLVRMLARAGLASERLRLYRRECMSALAVGGEPAAGPFADERHATEVICALKRHRWQYYATLMFAWRKIHPLRDWAFYGAYDDITFPEAQ